MGRELQTIFVTISSKDLPFSISTQHNYIRFKGGVFQEAGKILLERIKISLSAKSSFVTFSKINDYWMKDA